MQPTFADAHAQPAINPSKGSWLARVSHRASHIPNRPPNSAGLTSKDALSLRTPNTPVPAGSHEQLPVLQKTSSYPASPVSPTETEFGTTPIDSTFGKRVDTPPDRPPPDRPAHERNGLSQRSRAATLDQVSEETMDKYARQAGDHTYDSDAEADDEFERSIFTSPLLADDDTDHPSDSDEDHESIDGEDTPTTQGWAEREGRSPAGKIVQWTTEEVAEWVSSLAPSFKQYGPLINEENITGFALVQLQHEELRELGVASVGHRLTILKAVYEQKMRAGVKIEEGDYIPLSVDADRGDTTATQDDIARIIDSLRLRDQRIIAAETELRVLKQELERISEDNRKLREETLPVMRIMKDQRTPLPDPAAPPISSPREAEPKQSESAASNPPKSAGLTRKFSAKKMLNLNNKQPSPTYPPQPSGTQREVRDDGGTHLEASAAAMAASSHLTASMASQTSPNSVHGSQLSPTSPAYSTHTAATGISYQPPGSSTSRSFPRDAARHDPRGYSGHIDDTSHWSSASTVVADPPPSARLQERSRRQQPTPSPREEDPSARDKDNPQVEIFKSFRVSIEDPCRVVLPVALKRYNITDDWRQYALYIVHGDQERCLGLDEKPLMLFKQLDKEGRKPMFMLRRHASPQEGWSGAAGGGHGQERSSTQIPGGVL